MSRWPPGCGDGVRDIGYNPIPYTLSLYPSSLSNHDSRVYDARVLCGVVAVPAVPLRLEGGQLDVLHLLVSCYVLPRPLGALRPRSLHAVLGLVRYGSTAVGSATQRV